MDEDDESPVHGQRVRVSRHLATWSQIPAVLVDRHLTVLSSNALARSLSVGFAVGENLARFTFLDPQISRGGEAFRAVAEQIAGMLNDSLDEHSVDSEFQAIVGELSVKSRDFSEAWATESIGAKPTGIATFFASPVGTITLGYSLVKIPEDPDDTLLIFCAIDDVTQVVLSTLIEHVDAAPRE